MHQQLAHFLPMWSMSFLAEKDKKIGIGCQAVRHPHLQLIILYYPVSDIYWWKGQASNIYRMIILTDSLNTTSVTCSMSAQIYPCTFILPSSANNILLVQRDIISNVWSHQTFYILEILWRSKNWDLFSENLYILYSIRLK